MFATGRINEGKALSKSKVTRYSRNGDEIGIRVCLNRNLLQKFSVVISWALLLRKLENWNPR